MDQATSVLSIKNNWNLKMNPWNMLFNERNNWLIAINPHVWVPCYMFLAYLLTLRFYQGIELGVRLFHWENGGTFGMLLLIINPIYAFIYGYRYWFYWVYPPFKGSNRRVKQFGAPLFQWTPPFSLWKFQGFSPKLPHCFTVRICHKHQLNAGR